MMSTKTFQVFDPVARIRKVSQEIVENWKKDENGKFFQVKSTYVETIEQEKFLRNMPKALDDRIVQQVRHGDVLYQGPIGDPL